jgi:hypothetical protein
MWMGECSASRRGRFTPRKESWYPLNRRLGGHHSRSGNLEKTLVPPVGILTPDGLPRSLTGLPRLLSALNNQNYIRRRKNSDSFYSCNRQALEYTYVTQCSTKNCYEETWICAQFHGKFITTCHEIAYGNSANAETYPRTPLIHRTLHLTQEYVL